MPWGAIIGIAVRAIGMGLDRMKASTIARESFLAFVNTMQDEKIIPAQASKSWQSMKDQMKEDEKGWPDA